MTGMPVSHASPEFVEVLRNAMEHLYDPIALRQSPLMGLLDIGPQRGAMALRAILTEAANILKPRDEMRTEAPAWRPYRAIFHRYIEQFSQREVAAALSLSVRQLRREEKKAFHSLADYLWTHYNVQNKVDLLARLGQEAESPLASSQEEELRWLEESSPSQVADLRGVLEEILSVARRLADPLQVRLEYTSPQTPSPIQTRVTSMRQALLTVLTTAIRAVPQGTVRIILQEDEKNAYLVLVAECSASSAGETSCCPNGEFDLPRRLTELSGGTMRLRTNVTPVCPLDVVLSFPLAERQTILVIDDNADTLALFERYLAGTNYSFFGLSDPHRAVEMAVAIHPALIFLDVMLPGTDGWELLQRLREHPKLTKVPIVVCTILHEKELAQALGAANLLCKPITRQRFLTEIDAQLGSGRRDG
ncbi:MAG: response regulator [Chloroflexi bacterium]|nr:response regulator [Chloroflexota bacterium]